MEEQRLTVAERFSLLALWGFPNICEFIEVELGQKESCGPHKILRRAPSGRALVPCEALVGLLASSRSFQGFFCPEKISKKFCGIWTSFGTVSLKSQKQAENHNWHWALG